MKKILYTLLIGLVVVACVKDPIEDLFLVATPQPLTIAAEEGLKFENSNINDGDKFNLKTLTAGKYAIEIEDHFKNVVSKSFINAESGDNLYTFYTEAFQDGDYTITITYNGEQVHEVRYTIN